MRTKREGTAGANNTFAIGRISCSENPPQRIVSESSVLRIHICTEKPVIANKQKLFEIATRRIKYLLLFILWFFSTLAYGQSMSDSLLVSCYNQALISYFSDTTNHKGQNKQQSILIFTNIKTTELIEIIGSYHFLYHLKPTEMKDVLDRPLRKNKGRFIYSASHLYNGNDTIDVNLNGTTIVDIDRRYTTISIWCGGTLGYIPTARFIFDQSRDDWIFYDQTTLIKLKLDERSNYR